MKCAMSHGQVFVSGHAVLPRHDKRWTRAQLEGRTIEICSDGKPFRQGVLFGPESVWRGERDFEMVLK